MFASSGYFKGFNCPYFANGLCERPHCHFRHVSEEKGSVGFDSYQTAQPTQTKSKEVSSVTKSKAHANKPEGSPRRSNLLNAVGNAIKEIEKDIERDRHRLTVLKGKAFELENGDSVPGYTPTKPTEGSNATKKSNLPPHIGWYNPTPIPKGSPHSNGYTNSNKNQNPPQKHASVKNRTYTDPKSGPPQYKPTSKKLLEKRKYGNGEYSVESSSELEYNPGDNYKTKSTAAYIPGGKRKHEKYYVGPAKKKKIDFKLPEVEAKFSDDDMTEEEVVQEKNNKQLGQDKNTELLVQEKNAEESSEPQENELIDNAEKNSSDKEMLDETRTNVNDNNEESGKEKQETQQVKIKKEKVDDAIIIEDDDDGDVVKKKKDKNGTKLDIRIGQNIFDVMRDKLKSVKVPKQMITIKIEDSDDEFPENNFSANNDNSNIDMTKIKNELKSPKKEPLSQEENVIIKQEDCFETFVPEPICIIDLKKESEIEIKDEQDAFDPDIIIKNEKNSELNDEENVQEKEDVSKDMSSGDDKSKPSSSSTKKHSGSSHSSSSKHRHSRSSSKDSKHRSSSSSSRRHTSSSKKHSSPNGHSSKHGSSSKHKSSSSSSDRHGSKHSSSSKDSKHQSSHKHDKSSSNKKSSSSSSSSHHSSHKQDKHSSSKHHKQSSHSESKSSHKHSKSRQDNDDKKDGTMLPKVEKQMSHVDLFGEDSDTEMTMDDIVPLEDSEDLQDALDSIVELSDTEEQEDSAADISAELKLDEIDFDEEMEEADPYDECLKLFNEDNLANKVKREKNISMEISQAGQKQAEPSSSVSFGKQRRAHGGMNQAAMKRTSVEKPTVRPSPAQVMQSRMMQMQKRAIDVAEKRAREMAKRRAQQVQSRSETSSSTDLALGAKKRQAHAPKVFIDKPNTADDTSKTTSNLGPNYNSTKFKKREAHLPTSIIKRPTIAVDSGNKVPINIRQRYLNQFIDECLKIYTDEASSFERALAEEKKVYDRSSGKKIYLNVAVNTIKRLRNETNMNPGLTSPTRSSPHKCKQVLSHQAMLGGSRAANTSFSIRKAVAKEPDRYSGADLYKRLSTYILTEEELVDNRFPRTDPSQPGSALIQRDEKDIQKSATSSDAERICRRCGKRFDVLEDDSFARPEECVFHWGKAWKKKVARVWDVRYTCCDGDFGAAGCQVASAHVHEQNKYTIMSGYMKTMPCSPPLNGDWGVYALDCEMVYTTIGMELARITVTNSENNPVFEKIVQPENPIVDYNTRFSGLSEKDLKGVKTRIRDIQAVLLSMFNDRTILIGHSLESDLTSMKLIHNTVVDTSVVFPHKLGRPYKRALKTLMAEFLNRIIQNDVGGHDSNEDATSCMDLMMWKLKEDAKKRR